MKIGIFDTGLGGEIAAERLRRYFPDAQFTVVNDRAHLPYGSKSSEEIYTLTHAAISPLIGNCDVLVIACNTATAAAIDRLREEFPDQKFVGYEPMVKPATALSRTGRIVILATPAMAASVRYQKLVAEYGQGVQISTPDCATWASDIEAGNADAVNLGDIDANADVIVLACTHYLALQDRIARAFPAAQVIEPTKAVASRIASLVSQPQQ